MKITKKSLKKHTILLSALFLVITAGLTVGSKYLNQKEKNSTETTLNYIEVEPSNRAIISSTDESYEVMLATNEISYDKIGNGIYILKDVEESEVSALNLDSSVNEGTSVERDIPFVVSTDEDVSNEVTTSEEIEDRAEELPEGYTWKQLAQERGQKLVAIIDTGVNNYAIHSVDFTGSGVEDNNGHGTYMAQVIDNNSDNKAMIISLKAIGNDGIGYMSDIMQAIQYARDIEADIINMSFASDAGEGREAFVGLVQSAISDGITVVAAAGNYNSDVQYYIPASISGVISVGAVDEEGKKTSSSNYGEVTYYEQAYSTSEAAAIITGKIARAADFSELLTNRDVNIDKSTISEEHKEVFTEEDGKFIVQAVYQNFSLRIATAGSVNDVAISGLTAATQDVYGYYNKDQDFDLNYTIAGGVQYMWGIQVGGVTPMNGYVFTKVSVENSIAYGQYAKADGDHTTFPLYIVPPNDGTFSKMTVYTRLATVTVNLDGGSGTSGTFTSTGANSTKNLGTPTKTGYKFTGWKVTSGGGSISGTTYSYGRSDGTVTAQWEKADYTLTFDPNGGSVSPTSRTVTSGSTYGTLPTPTYAGYTFDGWYTAKTGGTKVSSSTTMGSANTTIYAHWSANSYTNYLYYDLQGGSEGPSTGSKTVTYPNTQCSISVSTKEPTKSGYTFAGWYTAASGGTKVGTTVTVGSNNYAGNQSATIYAHWTANTYTNYVYYDKNTSATVSGMPTTASSKSVTYPNTQCTISLSSASPTRTGYDFAGWYTAASGGTKVTSVTVGSNNVAGNQSTTVYAHWTAHTYKVVFDGNGGNYVRGSTSVTTPTNVRQKVSGSTAEESFTYDVSKALNANGFSWDGHTFLGWSESKTATAATYTDKKSVSNLTSTNNGTVTLYAIWSANQYTITVDPVTPNGTWKGSGSKATVNCYWGDTITASGTPQAPSTQSSMGQATPANWTVTVTYDVNGDGAVITGSGATTATSTWLFDQWSVSSGAHGFFISDDNRSASCKYLVQDTNDTLTAKYYYSTITLPSATRTGYTFMGWYYDAECTQKATGRDGSTGNAGSVFRPTENVTLYARWEKTSFNFDELMSSFMQDSTTSDTDVYIRKIDGTTLKPITTKKNTSAVIGIYKNSVSSSNLVLKLDTKDGVYNASGTLVIPASSADSNGYYNITSYLTKGTSYVMSEISPPEGYLKAEDISFTYSGTERVQISMKDDRMNIQDIPDLKVKKVNSNGDKVQGAVFELKNETTGEIKATFTSDEDGIICDHLEDYLTAGNTYTLSEVSAPAGYELADPITFVAPSTQEEANNLPSFVVVDEYKDVSLTVRKENSNGTALSGATFQLFTKDADGDLQPVYIDSTTNSYVKDKNEANAVKAILTTDDTGTITFNNLPLRASYTGSEPDYTKSYYLKELAAPAGYNPLPEVMEILLPDDGSTSFTYTATDESVVLTLEAGGNGTNMYIFYGCGLICLAIVALLIKKL